MNFMGNNHSHILSNNLLGEVLKSFWQISKETFPLAICFLRIIRENLGGKSEILQLGKGISRDSFQRWKPLVITDDE